MEEIFFKNDCVTLTYDKDRQLGAAHWRGFISGDRFREASLKCVEMINQFGLTKWLADNRKMKAIRQQDQQWAVEELVPMLLESPLRQMATVVSEDIFNKMAVEQMIKRAKPLPGLATHDFDTPEAALEWLNVTESAPEKASPSKQPEH
ncbi:MAG: hypothetical protein LPK19_05230 [Hymenobacteraceae bacterium]|nr:hypothetical protein [Hymenobacteraceae bacterium]MDX5395602.1 hypothetical protein [Hymenobacteraceae bacterium]MDX5511654.1 hypothetical protein [Hymenobacteraceae bacterium]